MKYLLIYAAKLHTGKTRPSFLVVSAASCNDAMEKLIEKEGELPTIYECRVSKGIDSATYFERFCRDILQSPLSNFSPIRLPIQRRY